jgi:hypothetical protein
MNVSAQTLPDGYAQSGVINLKKNKRLAITLNLVGFFIAALTFYLLVNLGALLRPGIFPISGNILAGLVLILGLQVIMITVHELIHGLFFWVFTRSRPVFAMRLLYAYAGAPAWYLPTRQYAVVTVGPLVVIDVVGLLLMLLGPESWVLMTAFIVAMNTGGAIGDLLVFIRLFKLSPKSLANDTGDVVTFYELPPAVSHPGGRPRADVRQM